VAEVERMDAGDLAGESAALDDVVRRHGPEAEP
jgi:hypothetical protein